MINLILLSSTCQSRRWSPDNGNLGNHSPRPGNPCCIDSTGVLFRLPQLEVKVFLVQRVQWSSLSQAHRCLPENAAELRVPGSQSMTTMTKTRKTNLCPLEFHSRQGSSRWSSMHPGPLYSGLHSLRSHPWEQELEFLSSPSLCHLGYPRLPSSSPWLWLWQWQFWQWWTEL